VNSRGRLLRETRRVRCGNCVSNGEINIEKVGEIGFVSTLLPTDRGEHERIDMAYLLERGLFMAINKPTFHRKPPLSSSLSSYPNAQQILNRKLLPYYKNALC
tara:strand:- start:2 stop:310 length:309 start_codon:yes stop_codon:yes gene_type:complete